MIEFKDKIIVGETKGKFSVINSSTLQLEARIQTNIQGDCRALCSFKDYLLIGDNLGNLYQTELIEYRNSSLKQNFHSRCVTALLFAHPNTIFSASEDKTVKMSVLSSGK